MCAREIDDVMGFRKTKKNENEIDRFCAFIYRAASNVAMANPMVDSYLNQGIGPIPGVSCWC